MKSLLELERAAYIGGNKELADYYYDRLYELEQYIEDEDDRLADARKEGYEAGKDADLAEQIMRLEDKVGTMYGRNQGLCNELQTAAEWLLSSNASLKANRKEMAKRLLRNAAALRGIP